MTNILEDNPLDPKYNVIKNNIFPNIEINSLISAGSTITKDEMREMNTIE